jgi:peptidyl-prolyl cis-trans isomerase C
MKTWITAAALALAPVLALGQALPGKEAAKPPAKAAAKPAAKAPSKPAAEQSGPLATVNGVAVPRARADHLMRQQGSRGMPDNEETRAMVRDELINREVLAQEAQKSGIAKSAEVQTQLDMARQEILIGAYVRDWIRKNPVTESDVQKEYERAKAETGDKEYRARHILVETEEQATALIAQLGKGGNFADLAAKNSKDPGSAQRGGDLDWNVPQQYDKQFAEAMVKLEKGQYTQTPVRSAFGFHVIQLDDVRPVQFPPLSEVRSRIQQDLVQTKVQGLIQGLRAKAKVE